MSLFGLSSSLVKRLPSLLISTPPSRYKSVEGLTAVVKKLIKKGRKIH